MRTDKKSLYVFVVLCSWGALASSVYAADPGSFAPFQAWKAAVVAGDVTAIARSYSTHPPAVAQVGKNKLDNLDEEWRFWGGLKSAGATGFNPKVLQVVETQGQKRLLLRVEVNKPDGPQVASMLQIWAEQPDGWHMVASRRTAFSPNAIRRLPQPEAPNTSLYSDPSQAQAEVTEALSRAAKEHKRVILVFGANWCYDCHVLDATFRSSEFAPLVNANYVVVHISIGDEGKDNQKLAAHFGVALDKGVPCLAVLEPDGKVVFAQKGGEFESTVKIGPQEVRAFLEKWKPAPKAGGA